MCNTIKINGSIDELSMYVILKQALTGNYEIVINDNRFIETTWESCSYSCGMRCKDGTYRHAEVVSKAKVLQFALADMGHPMSYEWYVNFTRAIDNEIF